MSTINCFLVDNFLSLLFAKPNKEEFVLNNYLRYLIQTKLFENINKEEIEQIFNCIYAKISLYKKNEFIINQSQNIDWIGLILDGTAHAVKDDFSGDRFILSYFKKNDTFGEDYIFSNTKQSTYSIICTSYKCEILKFKFKCIENNCFKKCEMYNIFIKNALSISTQKNALLSLRLEFLSKKTIRKKISYYLLYQMKLQNSRTVKIPYNRTQLAEFLCIDRSAMTRELYNMKKIGLICFDKKNIEINDLLIKDYI